MQHGACFIVAKAQSLSESGLGAAVIEVPGHVNGSRLSSFGLVCGRRRRHVPSHVFLGVLICLGLVCCF